jgi:hypothetical protein
MTQEAELPKRYHLDESDPDILVLRRDNGTFVVDFRARGATNSGLFEAARKGYGALIKRFA